MDYHARFTCSSFIHTPFQIFLHAVRHRTALPHPSNPPPLIVIISPLPLSLFFLYERNSKGEWQRYTSLHFHCFCPQPKSASSHLWLFTVYLSNLIDCSFAILSLNTQSIIYLLLTTTIKHCCLYFHFHSPYFVYHRCAAINHSIIFIPYIFCFQNVISYEIFTLSCAM